MEIRVRGALPEGVTAKDLALAIIGQIRTDGATGYAVEYSGEAVRALSMEGRMTLCNMTIEAGARAGMVAPDETPSRTSRADALLRAARPGRGGRALALARDG